MKLWLSGSRYFLCDWIMKNIPIFFSFFFLSFLFTFVRSIEIRAYTRVILFTFSFSRLQRFSFLRLNLEYCSLLDVACHLVVEIERKGDRDNHLKTGTKENNLFAMLRSLIMLLRKVFFSFFLRRHFDVCAHSDDC